VWGKARECGGLYFASGYFVSAYPIDCVRVAMMRHADTLMGRKVDRMPPVDFPLYPYCGLTAEVSYRTTVPPCIKPNTRTLRED
jgi:hypothetical protein